MYAYIKATLLDWDVIEILYVRRMYFATCKVMDFWEVYVHLKLNLYTTIDSPH